MEHSQHANIDIRMDSYFKDGCTVNAHHAPVTSIDLLSHCSLRFPSVFRVEVSAAAAAVCCLLHLLRCCVLFACVYCMAPCVESCGV